jgi:UDP-N-acetyl-D-mannosaminuronic acid dehydrogenase
VEIVHQLSKQADISLSVVEPNLKSHAQFDLVALDTALERADIVLFLVGHREFKAISPRALEEKVVFDTCGVLREPSRQ